MNLFRNLEILKLYEVLQSFQSVPESHLSNGYMMRYLHV